MKVSSRLNVQFFDFNVSQSDAHVQRAELYVHIFPSVEQKAAHDSTIRLVVYRVGKLLSGESPILMKVR